VTPTERERRRVLAGEAIVRARELASCSLEAQRDRHYLEAEHFLSRAHAALSVARGLLRRTFDI
jgi:hypothetical protein